MLASGGLVTMNANGTYAYDPNGAFAHLLDGQTANDSFTYQVSDGAGGVATATVNVTVSGVAKNNLNLTIGADIGLTTLDPFYGTAGNDTYTGSVLTGNPIFTTFFSNDKLDGAGGHDTLNVTISGTGSETLSGSELHNLDLVNLTNAKSAGSERSKPLCGQVSNKSLLSSPQSVSRQR